MKIEKRNQNSTIVEKVESGQVFRVRGQDELWLRGYMDGPTVYAASLVTGEISSFDPETLVYSVNAKVVEE